jgi:hypothetical protein
MGDQVVRHRERSVAQNREKKRQGRGGPKNETAIFPILHCKQAARGGSQVHAAHIMSNNTYDSTCSHTTGSWPSRAASRQGGKRSPFLQPALTLSRAALSESRKTRAPPLIAATLCSAVQCMHCIAGARAVYDDGSWEVWSPHPAALEESRWVRVSTAEQKVQVCACMAAVAPDR